jgi:hypothetical protein
MALVVKDRVQETSATTGTGTFTLSGAVTGFQSFSVIGDGNTTYYTIAGDGEWEVGIGTYTASGTTLSRDTILESSNGGTAVNFSAGIKNVFVTYPAEKSVDTETPQTITNKTIAPSQVSDQANTSTGYFDLPAGTTAQRPVSPTSGATRFNTTLGYPEWYDSVTALWVPFASVPSYNVDYLVVAGGGGGASGNGNGNGTGGGGAGGYLSGTATLGLGSVYTITVGAGGAGATTNTGTNQNGANGAAGSNSVLSGANITTQTSIGGGFGASILNTGGNGGSGGGGGSSNAGGSGTTGQGFGGGTGYGAASPFRGGGGGGSSAVGVNGVTSGSGGAGTASSITGSSVTRAGGGGGGCFTGNTPGSGGSGGGGAGGAGTGAGGAATVNTGSGGGGGGWPGTGTGGVGGNGGSGVVILSVQTANYTGVITGSPTVTTSGSNTIMQFTSSGTYTA